MINRILAGLLISAGSYGQVPIQTDRPDQTESPYIVPKNYIQVENGLLFEKQNKNVSTFEHPSTLWKFGLNDRLEFRLITQFISIKENDSVITGLSPVTFGFKTKLLEEKGWLPMTSFIGHITTSSLAGRKFKTSYIAPAFRFTMQHTLSERMALGYNLGAEWNGEDPQPTYIYTLTTGISITDKLGSYIELYGFLPDGSRPDHRFNGGLTWLLNNNTMIDVSGGPGLTSNAPEYFVAMGASFRFNTK